MSTPGISDWSNALRADLSPGTRQRSLPLTTPFAAAPRSAIGFTASQLPPTHHAEDSSDCLLANEVYQSQERRRAYRVPTNKHCELLLFDEPPHPTYLARLEDISLEGARIACQVDIACGTQVRLLLPGDSGNVYSAEVVRIHTTHGDERSYGLRLSQHWPLEIFYAVAFPEQHFTSSPAANPSLTMLDDHPAIDGYAFVRPLGRGGTGEVFQVLAPGAIPKAVKRIRLDPRSALCIREVLAYRLIRAVHHPFLISLDRLSIQRDHLVVVMELTEGTVREEFLERLAIGLKGLSRSRLLHLLRELSEVLDYLRDRHQLQHLDIKPDNLFLVAGHVKLGDFGLLRQVSEETLDDRICAVTPGYAAPEVLSGRVHRNSDQYSVAVVFVEMLTGQRPIAADNAQQIAYQYLTTGPDVSLLSPADRVIVMRALSLNPELRYPNCTDFINALEEVGVTSNAADDAEFRQETTEPIVLPTAKAAASPAARLQSPSGVDLALIPSGSFMMGAGDKEPWARDNERPQHYVSIDEPFYLGIHPITQQQYALVMGGNPSGFSPQGRYANWVKDLDTARFPVEHVTWWMAVDFCNRLSERESLPHFYEIFGQKIHRLGGAGYRLPTEAEWEYACRAGSQAAWCFGNDAELLDQYAWYRKDRAGRPAAVGQKLPNAFGLFDMHGNVLEWCWDWYGTHFYQGKYFASPTGPIVGIRRVLRGGSFYDPPERTRSAARHKGQPWDRGGNVGFRVVRGVA